MGYLLLAEIQPGISQPHINGIVFGNALVILVAFDIIPLGTFEEESVFQISDVWVDSLVIYLHMLHTRKSISDPAGIGKWAYRRTKRINKRLQCLSVFYIVAFYDIVYIRFVP